MDIFTALAIGLGLYALIKDILPQYYDEESNGNPIPAFLTSFEHFDINKDFNEFQQEKFTSHVFDFIVVGAGSAGSVVANRLSEKYDVLLIEAGGDPNPIQSVPLLAFDLVGFPEIDYMYKTVPQNSSCFALNNHESPWARGKGLGGSSNLNAMLYLRGHPRDYDNWARLTSDDRWNYRKLIPFFKKSEDLCFECERPEEDVLQPAFHRIGGPLSIGRHSFRPLTTEFVEGAEWNGIPRVDLNAPFGREGVASSTNFWRNGQRWSTFKAFLEPIRNSRRSLTIHKYSKAYEILFGKDNITAIGIKYERHGIPTFALANYEVVISAGAIDSPKLLMLSGIGPKEHLEELGIPVRVNSPGVGQNLQDHIMTSPGPFTINQPLSFLADRDLSMEQVDSFVTNGTGPFSVLVQGTALFTSTYTIKKKSEFNWPDLQWMMIGFGQSSTLANTFTSLFNIKPGIMEEYYKPALKQDGFQILIVITRPKSRGHLKLRSKDFNDMPIIDPKYFEDMAQEDIKVFVEGIKRTVYMAENAPSFKSIGTQLSPIPFPPCSNPSVIFRSDEYWECLARHLTMTVFHFCGTVAMGPRNSIGSVVDSELKVIGTNRLRVIDASIMPTIVGVNTNAPTIMIGERGAEFIKETWKGQRILRRHGWSRS